MKTTWHQSGNTFSLREVSQQIEKLPVALYVVRFDPRSGFYLEQTGDKFKLPKKLYGLTNSFADRVMKIYANTTGNLGVLLNGIRGTGKTVTCEMICNSMNMPVIILDTNYDGVGEFISSIQEDAIFFFDEFEKVFPRDYSSSPSKLLMIMDGVMKGQHRKLFLLTTNEVNIEPNMIQRPGRVRYIKTFGNLTPQVVTEIVDDQLINKAYKSELISFISELELITIDIVTALVEEVNIFDESPSEFKDVFNIKKLSEQHAVYEIIRKEDGSLLSETLLVDKARVYPNKFTEGHEGWEFTVNRTDLGMIASIIDETTIEVEPMPVDEDDDEDEKPVAILDGVAVGPDGKSAVAKAVKAPNRFFRIEPRYSLNSMFRSTKFFTD